MDLSANKGLIYKELPVRENLGKASLKVMDEVNVHVAVCAHADTKGDLLF